jgi:hypothetical protein
MHARKKAKRLDGLVTAGKLGGNDETPVTASEWLEGSVAWWGDRLARVGLLSATKMASSQENPSKLYCVSFPSSPSMLSFVGV